jgi:hypothetical protein
VTEALYEALSLALWLIDSEAEWLADSLAL